MLEESDWSVFVDRAVDDFLEQLREELSEDRSSWDALRSRPRQAELFRERLTSYSMQLVAAAAAGTGNIKCNNGSSTVDCDFVLRPNDTPYYRCLHAPPDCYDADHKTIPCP
jgi:hypothetical protein